MYTLFSYINIAEKNLYVYSNAYRIYETLNIDALYTYI